MSRDEKIVKVLKRILPIMSILTVFVFIMLINKKSYALFHKRIETDIMIHIQTSDELPPKKTGPANDVVKGTVVAGVTDTCKNFSEKGGLVAINTEGKLYQEGSGQEIREYRYVGPDVDNYIYFNCEADATEEDASSKCEVWRILGIFKDESGAEHIKIVRNETLKGDMMPSTYTAENGTEYNIRYSSTDNAYWNYKTDRTYNNDWTTGGLQYWLNAGSDKETKQASDGYMSYLSENAKSMIEYTKYYLGNFKYKVPAIDTYNSERGDTTCSGSCSGGDVWEGNKAIWNGNIVLMYPSDLGYSANSCNWNSSTLTQSGSYLTSWLYKVANHVTDEWLLSPSSHSSNDVAYWDSAGSVYDNIGNRNTVYSNNAVRPSLNLKSNINITGGDGSQENPYFVNSGQ